MQIKTNFIITCERAFLTAGSNNLNLIEIFTQINANKFPFAYPRFALVVNFDVDQLGQHQMQAQVLGPDGKTIATAQMQVDISSQNFQVITNFENLTFQVPGKYELRILVGDQLAGSRFLNVLPVSGQPPTTA